MIFPINNQLKALFDFSKVVSSKKTLSFQQHFECKKLLDPIDGFEEDVRFALDIHVQKTDRAVRGNPDQ